MERSTKNSSDSVSDITGRERFDSTLMTFNTFILTLTNIVNSLFIVTIIL